MLGLVLRLRYLGRRWVLRQRHQQVGEVDFLRQRVGIGGLARGQGVFHLGVRDAHTRIHLALMQAAKHNLVADLLTKSGLADAALAQALAELGQVHLVLGCEIAFGLVNGASIGAHAEIAGKLQLRALVDHAFKHQGAQLVRRWKRLALLRALLGNLLDLGLQLAIGDRLRVHQRNDEIPALAALRKRGAGAASKQSNKGGRSGQEMQFHGG